MYVMIVMVKCLERNVERNLCFLFMILDLKSKSLRKKTKMMVINLDKLYVVILLECVCLSIACTSMWHKLVLAYSSKSSFRLVDKSYRPSPLQFRPFLTCLLISFSERKVKSQILPNTLLEGQARGKSSLESFRVFSL